MNRFAIPLGVFGLLVVIFGVTLWRTPETPVVTSALIGKPAPIFTLPDLLQPGSTVTNESFKGRWYLINVWGTWCVACREEHAALLEIGRQNALPLVGLSWKDEDDAALEWLAQLGNPYSVVAVDHDGRTAIDFGVYGAPETFFIDANGRVQYRHVGAMTQAVWEREFLARVPRGGLP